MSEQNVSPNPLNEISKKQSVRTAFGALAPAYDTWYHTPIGRYVWSVEVSAVRSMLPYEVKGIVFDVGTGTGMSLTLLRSNHYQLIGIDNSWQMIEIAHQKTYERQDVELVVADGECLPFRSNVADLIFGMTVIEFVPNPDQFLQEMYSCLHPQGWLVLGVLTSTNLWALERRIRSFVQPDVFSYAHFPSPWQLIRRLHQNGFHRTRYRGAVYAPTFTPARCLETLSRIENMLGDRWLSRAFGAFSVVQAQSVKIT
jgi:ubiquinone/menaquinone biosynthesis C-methylase UbiE